MLALAAGGFGGCSSISERLGQTIADTSMGLPAGTPERSATQAAYPAVHDMPPPRPETLSAEQQNRLEDDLVAARTRQQAFAPPAPAVVAAPAPAPAPAPRKKTPAPAANPAPSASSIY